MFQYSPILGRSSIWDLKYTFSVTQNFTLFSQNWRSNIKNCWTITRLVCTNLNAFCMLNPNMVMKFWIWTCCLHSTFIWRGFKFVLRQSWLFDFDSWCQVWDWWCWIFLLLYFLYARGCILNLKCTEYLHNVELLCF